MSLINDTGYLVEVAIGLLLAVAIAVIAHREFRLGIGWSILLALVLFVVLDYPINENLSGNLPN